MMSLGIYLVKNKCHRALKQWLPISGRSRAMHPGRSIFSENTKIPEQGIITLRWGGAAWGAGTLPSFILPVLLIYCAGKGMTMKDEGLFIMFG
jgi:hypothetical protein